MKISKARLLEIIKEEVEKNFLQEETLEQESKDEFQQQVEEWIQLNKEMESIKQKIKVMVAKSDELEKKLLPVVKEMEGQRAIVNDSIVKFKERNITSPSYKSMFEVALTKVNEATKRILLEVQEQFTKRSTKQSLELDEGKFIDFLKSLWNNINIFKKSVSDLQKVANMGEIKEEKKEEDK